MRRRNGGLLELEFKIHELRGEIERLTRGSGTVAVIWPLDCGTEMDEAPKMDGALMEEDLTVRQRG